MENYKNTDPVVCKEHINLDNCELHGECTIPPEEMEIIKEYCDTLATNRDRNGGVV